MIDDDAPMREAIKALENAVTHLGKTDRSLNADEIQRVESLSVRLQVIIRLKKGA